MKILKNKLKPYQNHHLIYINWIVLIIVFCACKVRKCEEFDLNRVLSDSCSFYSNYSYTNSIDTIQFSLERTYNTGEHISDRGVINIYPCEPYYELVFASRKLNFEVIYTFSYLDYEKDKPTRLSILFNSSYMAIDYDTTMRLGHSIVLNNFTHYGKVEISRKINKLTLENLKISEIEMANGEVWKLCAYEDKLR